MCLQSMLNRSKAIKLAPKFMRSERVSRCECCQAVLGGPNPSSSSKLCACLSACQRLRIFLPRLARRHHQKQHVHRHLQSHRHCQTHRRIHLMGMGCPYTVSFQETSILAMMLLWNCLCTTIVSHKANRKSMLKTRSFLSSLPGNSASKTDFI